MIRRALACCALLGACSLDTGIFAGKSCESVLDCPAPYTCADVRPGGRTCELLRPIDISSAPGVATFYCAGPSGGPDVHTVVENFCLVNCHGVDKGYGQGVPMNFRLDIYAPQPGCGGMCLGALSQAALMKVDVDTGSMPPPLETALPQPTAADKLVIAQWVASSMPLAPDGVMVGNDCSTAGKPPDAGTPDAGAADGG